MKLEISPTTKQALVWERLFDSETKFILFGGGAGGAKSWMICDWLVYMCLQYPGTKYFIARKELKRIMGSTYITFLKVCKWHSIPRDMWHLNGQYNYIEWTNGSRIDLLDVDYMPSDPLYERFGSLEMTDGALEEIGEINELAFDVLKSRVNRHMNVEYGIPAKILMTCNPKKNWAYYRFYQPWKNNSLPIDCCFIQALYQDNPYTAATYGETLATISDPIMKQRLMYGNWEYEDDPAKLFEYDEILNMFTNSYIEQLDPKLYLSVDVARFGSDKTVFVFWKSFYIERIWVYEKKDLEYIKTQIESLLKHYNIPRSQVVIDEDGVGGGLVDGLKGVKGFVNNSRPYTRDNISSGNTIIHNYGNLKSQCYFALAEAVHKNKIGIYKEIPSNTKQLLIQELENVKRKDADKDSKIMVTPKEDFKDLIGRSPDFADAMMMRFYFEVATPPKYRPAMA